MKHVTLKTGEQVPALGLGTWHMGERDGRRMREIDALKAGLDLGLNLIDTAEMYGEGGAEKIVAKALAGRRDKVFVVSKVYPHNASYRGILHACERSLKRLETETIDLYLLHWRGSYSLTETIEGFETLKDQGKIRYWGVSNFDAVDMAELLSADGGEGCVVNQVLYNLTERGIEWDLIDHARLNDIATMAYSPLAQGDLMDDETLGGIAETHGVAPAAVALAWVMNQHRTITIPKAASLEHVKQNAAALDVKLSPEELKQLDAAFPPPMGPSPLAIL
ncbi:MAG: aldo/keto reductase [Rhizobiales bacterium]|nr:aldo/keto reductase [Hyphomicrobiales bacterium]